MMYKKLLTKPYKKILAAYGYKDFAPRAFLFHDTIQQRGWEDYWYGYKPMPPRVKQWIDGLCRNGGGR